MGRKYNYVDIDFAVRVLNHPELIDDEEMRLWLRDEGHCRLLEELRRVREGSLRTVDGLRPGVNFEWEKFPKKNFTGLPDRDGNGLYRDTYFGGLVVEPPVSCDAGGFSDGAGGRGSCRE